MVFPAYSVIKKAEKKTLLNLDISKLFRYICLYGSKSRIVIYEYYGIIDKFDAFSDLSITFCSLEKYMLNVFFSSHDQGKLTNENAFFYEQIYPQNVL